MTPRLAIAVLLGFTCIGPVGAYDARDDTAPCDGRHAQETLDHLGYPVGHIDGRLGPRTRTAIRNFQRDNGLNATGELTDETVRAMDAAATERARRSENRSARATADASIVRGAQQHLDRLGYPVAHIDGRFGPETRTAIRNFQRDKGLNATGELDDDTRAALERDSGSATSGTR